jgi:hypothetical protein
VSDPTTDAFGEEVVVQPAVASRPAEPVAARNCRREMPRPGAPTSDIQVVLGRWLS